MVTITDRSAVVVIVAAMVVAGLVVAGGVAGQQEADEAGDESFDQDTTFLRVAHVSPDAPAVDVFVDGEEVLSDVEFGDVSDYLVLSAGEYDVEITPAGDEDTTVFEGNVTLEPRQATTLYAAGEVGDDASQPFEPILLDDDAFEPGDNESTVSVVHLSPDAPTVDVTADDGDVVLAENVSYGNASEYTNVSAGEYTVEVRPATADNDGDVVATANVTLEGGTAYSVLAVGYVGGFESELGEAFQLSPIEDATVTIDLPSEDEETPEEDEEPTPEEDEEAPEEDEETPDEDEEATPEEATPTETVTPDEETPTETVTPDGGTPTPTVETETPTPTAETPEDTPPAETPTATPDEVTTPD